MPSAIAQLERHAEARAQMAWADLLLLTHADLTDSNQHAEQMDYLNSHAPATPTLSVTLDQFEVDALHDYVPSAFRRIPAGNAVPEHGFHSMSLYLEHTPAWSRMQAALQTLLANHADDVMRIKGVVYCPECITPLVVHGAAGHLYPPAPLPERPNQDRRSRLVLITTLDPEHLVNLLLISLGVEIDRNSLRIQ